MKTPDRQQMYPLPVRGNIIKSRFIAREPRQRIETCDPAHMPEVVVQRKGEDIEYVHVTCRCGVTTAIKLEYEGHPEGETR
ncbi:MAG TPA: hypothetical protein VMW43_04915 [Bacteroidota bacterium]|nr:hypothetical protein [Bacteroidota bacterium]